MDLRPSEVCRSLHRAATTVERELGRAVSLLTVLPRSMQSAAAAMNRNPDRGIPPAPPSRRTTVECAVDEILIAAQMLVSDVPTRRDVKHAVRRTAEVADALSGLAPRDLHPPSTEPRDVTIDERRTRYRTTWEAMTFEVDDALPAALAECAEWRAEPGLLTARTRLLRHEGAPRPWVIAVHGADQGNDFDLVTLRARHLHEDLGLNVALPVLPLHGPRRSDGVRIPSFDPVTNVAFALRAVTEVRALRRWIERQGDPAVGLFGTSMGGYVTALTAGVEPGLDVVIAGIPMVSIHRLLVRHTARSGTREGRAIGALLRSDPVHELERFVDPLRFEPLVPFERRHVIAGLIDRVTTPHQALQLLQHWDDPDVVWFPGGHVGHFWSKEVRGHVDQILSGLSSRRRHPGRGDSTHRQVAG